MLSAGHPRFKSERLTTLELKTVYKFSRHLVWLAISVSRKEGTRTDVKEGSKEGRNDKQNMRKERSKEGREQGNSKQRQNICGISTVRAAWGLILRCFAWFSFGENFQHSLLQALPLLFLSWFPRLSAVTQVSTSLEEGGAF